jgi:DNA-binding MarR family transcriptional regulator
VAEIGEALGLDSGTLSPLLQRLERLGLIRRERSTEDERVVRIRVTPRGASMEARVTPVRIAVESATGLDEDQFRSCARTSTGSPRRSARTALGRQRRPSRSCAAQPPVSSMP